MSKYFPLFYNIDNKKILLVGGGAVAHEKLEKLLEFEVNPLIVAKECSLEFLDLAKELKIKIKPFDKDDLDGVDIVIAAIDDIALQEQIFKLTRETATLCNVVDNQKYCDFIFPSFIKDDDLTIAISTSGSSPAFAKELKKHIKNSLPSGIGEFLQKMKDLRKSEPKGKARMKKFSYMAKEFFKSKI